MDRGGPFWRRRRTDPVQKIEWLISYEPTDNRGHPGGWDDGVVDDTERELADWRSGRFTLPRGEVAWLEWLPEPGAGTIRESIGWPT